MSRPATAKQKRWFSRVADLGCLVCKSPAIIHHIETYMGGGRDHDRVIPLCPRHHQYHGVGVSLHDNKTEWQMIYGTEEELLEKVNGLLKV